MPAAPVQHAQDQPPAQKRPDRAILYVDGNNWYHFVADKQQGLGIVNSFDLSYAKISAKLVGPREWRGTRYYIGALKQDWNPKDYANQRAFLAMIQKDDPRISVHLGRLERRAQDNPLVDPLMRLVEDPKSGIPKPALMQVRALVKGFARVETLKEKAVDVMLARDLLVGAMQDAYDS